MRGVLAGCFVVLMMSAAFAAPNKEAAPKDVAPKEAEQEWTRFRGPNGTGLSATKGIPTTWTESDYLWKVALPGVGHSSPVIWGDRVFVTSADDESAERMVMCVAAADGKLLWERRYPSSIHKKHLKNSFASATPTVDRDHVYVCWSAPDEYLVRALDHQGQEVWKVDLGSVVTQHSTGVSPIVYDGMLILGNDQDGEQTEEKPGLSSYVALDCKDGWLTAPTSQMRVASSGDPTWRTTRVRRMIRFGPG